MSESEDGKVVSLEEHQQRLQQAKEEDEEDAEPGFCFDQFTFHQECVGTNSLGVVIVLNDHLQGIWMHPDDAEALGVSLIQSANLRRLEEDGIIKYTDGEP